MASKGVVPGYVSNLPASKNKSKIGTTNKGTRKTQKVKPADNVTGNKREPKVKTTRKRKKTDVGTEYDSNEDELTTLNKKQVSTLDQLLTLKAGEVFNWLYGITPQFKYIEEAQPLKKAKKEDREIKMVNSRDWWERASAVTQCANTVGKREKAKECYICGLAINNKSIDENVPECEHILPVFLGSLLLTLYRGDLSEKALKGKLEGIPKNDAQRRALELNLHSQIKKELGMEYEWAHRCCNQIKKDISFIKFDKETNTFKFNYEECKTMLEKIKGSPASYCTGKIKKAIQTKDKDITNKFRSEKDYRNWVASRLDIIGNQRIEPICNYLNNSLGANGKGIFYLSVLASLISSADLRVIKLAQDKSGYTNIRRLELAENTVKISKTPEIIQSVPFREAIITANIYHSFSEHWSTKIEEFKNKPATFLQLAKTLKNGGDITLLGYSNYNFEGGTKRKRTESSSIESQGLQQDVGTFQNVSKNVNNGESSNENHNKNKNIYKVAAKMFGKTSTQSDRIDYTTTYKYILSCFMTKSFVKKHGNTKLLLSKYNRNNLDFHYNYILRDLISILYFSNTTSTTLNFESLKDNFGLVVDISTIATKFATICFFYLNLVFTTSLSSSSNQNTALIYTDFTNELTSMLQEHKNELIKKTTVIPNLYNSISFITNIMISTISGINDISTRIPVMLDVTTNTEEIMPLLSHQNLLYCRMEYYKNYSEQYTELVTNVQESFGEDEDFLPNAEAIAVNVLEGLKNGTINYSDIHNFVKSPNKNISSKLANSNVLISPIVAPSPPQAVSESNDEYIKRVNTANTLIQMRNIELSQPNKENLPAKANSNSFSSMLRSDEKMNISPSTLPSQKQIENAVDILTKIKSQKLSLKEQTEWAESLEKFYEKNQQMFFKENPSKIIEEKTNLTLKTLVSMDVLVSSTIPRI